MAKTEVESFIEHWEREADRTEKMLKALPKDKYDFRPDPGARSIGEMAWHLAELDGYTGHGVEHKRFDMHEKVPGLERPKTVEALASNYRKVHEKALAQVRKLSDKDLDTKIVFFAGDPMPIRTILWDATLKHSIHHRGQLGLMNRLAGGKSPGIFGPNREEMAEMMKAASR